MKGAVVEAMKIPQKEVEVEWYGWVYWIIWGSTILKSKLMDKMLQLKFHNLAQEVVVVVLFRFLQNTLMVMVISALQEEMAL
jgi:hypothetical protein